MRQHDPDTRMQRSPERRHSRRRSSKLIPLVIFLLFGLFIATQEIPQVHDWVEGFISPDKARIRRVCVQEALGASRQSDFARVIEAGDIESTSNGYLVREIVIGEMGEHGNEVQYRFTCYLDTNGRVVNSHRED